jgi:hypothetical protein
VICGGYHGDFLNNEDEMEKTGKVSFVGVSGMDGDFTISFRVYGLGEYAWACWDRAFVSQIEDMARYRPGKAMNLCRKFLKQKGVRG